VTAAELAAQLRRDNLMYREPHLYDELIARGGSPVDAIAAEVDRFAPGAASVLDLGCGTGHVLRQLRGRCLAPVGAGVDTQTELLAHAAAGDPQCEWVQADVRGVRLRRTFDVVLCLGNTAAYMRSAAELAMLLLTAGAHSGPGTLLLITTLLGDGRPGESSNRLDTRLGPAKTYTSTSWNPQTRMLHTARRWEFDSGRVESDSILRRCPTVEEITRGLAHAGFQVLNLGGPAASLSVVARYLHCPPPPTHR
jgi:SAM-dependent methyltransferase